MDPIADDVADFRELGSFDFKEGRVRQLGEARRDLGLPRRCFLSADHVMVLGMDLFRAPIFGSELCRTHAVAQGDATARSRPFDRQRHCRVRRRFREASVRQACLLFFGGSGK